MEETQETQETQHTVEQQTAENQHQTDSKKESQEAADPYEFVLQTPETKNPLFDAFLDATYVLHVKGNGREATIKKEIQQYNPCSNTFIVYNAGPNNHEYNLYNSVNTPSRNITESYYRIFEHAQKNNYLNILILEDDAFFSDRIRDPQVILSITRFIEDKTQKKEPFLYSLGCLPLVAFPEPQPINHQQYSCCEFFKQLCSGAPEEQDEHFWGYFTATHACIYSREYREYLLQRKREMATWNWELVNPTGFFYYEPLVFQLFPETENQKSWEDSLPQGLKQIGRYSKTGFLKLLELETSTYGYFFMYAFAKSAWVILLLLVALIYFAIQYTANFIRSLACDLAPSFNLSIISVTDVTSPTPIPGVTSSTKETTTKEMPPPKNKPSVFEFISMKIPVHHNLQHNAEHIMQQQPLPQQPLPQQPLPQQPEPQCPFQQPFTECYKPFTDYLYDYRL